jgi:hypothetical protein
LSRCVVSPEAFISPRLETVHADRGASSVRFILLLFANVINSTEQCRDSRSERERERYLGEAGEVELSLPHDAKLNNKIITLLTK